MLDKLVKCVHVPQLPDLWFFKAYSCEKAFWCVLLLSWLIPWHCITIQIVFSVLLSCPLDWSSLVTWHRRKNFFGRNLNLSTLTFDWPVWSRDSGGRIWLVVKSFPHNLLISLFWSRGCGRTIWLVVNSVSRDPVSWWTRCRCCGSSTSGPTSLRTSPSGHSGNKIVIQC